MSVIIVITFIRPLVKLAGVFLKGKGVYRDVAFALLVTTSAQADFVIGDILVLIDAWGDAGGPADIDDSGTDGVGDMLAMVDSWGACP